MPRSFNDVSEEDLGLGGSREEVHDVERLEVITTLLTASLLFTLLLVLAL